MKLRVIGCGDAFGSGGRANTCFLVEAAAGPFLIDCGASALIKLKEYGVDPDQIGTVLISHLHGDHFGGLVFLLREASLYKRRTKRLTIAGPPGLRERLNSALEVFFPGGSQPPSTYELDLRELPAGVESVVDMTCVTPFPVHHPCGAVPYALRIRVEDRIIAYTGDTIWRDCLVDAGAGADLFLCEAYTYSQPMGSHLDYATVRGKIPAIKAKRTLLTHLGPEMIARMHELELEVAIDGMIVTF